MPTYEYKCNKCHAVYEDVRLIIDRDSPGKCPHCTYNRSTRIMSLPAMPHTASRRDPLKGRHKITEGSKTTTEYNGDYAHFKRTEKDKWKDRRLISNINRKERF